MIAKRLIRLGVFVALATLSSSCAANHDVLVRDLSSQESPRVVGYTTTNGLHHSFDGSLMMGADSLRFVRPAHEERGLELADPGAEAAVPRDSVASVTVRKTDMTRSVLLGIGVAAVAGAIVFLGIAASGSY